MKDVEQEESAFGILGEMDESIVIVRNCCFRIDNPEYLLAATIALERYDALQDRLMAALMRIELQSSLLLVKVRQLMASVNGEVCERCGYEGECRCDKDWQNADGRFTLPDVEGR